MEQWVVSLCPLGFLFFIFKFPELFQVLHVDEQLDEHQQQDANESHRCNGASDDSCHTGWFRTVSLFQNFSPVIILSDQLVQLKFDPAALCVLLLALPGWYGELVYHLMINALAASHTTVFFKRTRVKAKAFNAV